MRLAMGRILTLLALLWAISNTNAAEFYASPTGSDANPGTKDQPFATLERARDAARGIRGQKSEDRIQKSGDRIQKVEDRITIVLAQGTYRLTKTFALDERDSGTTYRGVNARIAGSVALPPSAVKPVTDAAVLERLLPEVRGKVMEVDLRALGVSDFGAIGPRGFRRPYIPAPLELFVDDEPLTLAQWPNPGQPGEPIGKVLDRGPVTRDGAKPDRGGTFEFKTARPARWAKAADVWITGLFANGYADNTVQVKSFDLAKHTLTTVQPHMYGFMSGQPWNRWVALNLLEEIDLPGEFVADKPSGKLYFLPPTGKDLAKCRLEVSVLKEPLVAIEGATGVVFDGVTFECSRGMGVYVERGANNRIQNSTLRNLGMVAICVGQGIAPDLLYRHGFDGTPVSRELGSWHEHIYFNTTFNRQAGTGHGIVGCHIYNIGAGAISLGGGDRLTLTPAGNFVENCDIHHFNRWDRSYKGAVNLDGVGNRVAHCRLHDAPALALYLHGNNHVVEYNEIFEAMTEGDDMGSVYLGRDPTEFGNIIRYNYFHDVGYGRTHGTFALYYDDGACGTELYGNLFVRAGRSATVFINKGRYNKTHDNIFVGCGTAVRLNHPVGVIHNKRTTSRDTFEARYQAVKADQPPYSTAYPELAKYWANLSVPNDPIMRNLAYKCGAFLSGQPAWGPATNNWETKDDPGFMDAAHGDYRLKPDAEAFQKIPGFKPGNPKEAKGQ
jgi:hypothetical protein